VKCIKRGHLFGGKIDCYIVDDGGRIRRMIGSSGIMAAIGSPGSGGLQRYLGRLPSRFIHLSNRPAIELSLPEGGMAKCYDAEHFSDVITAYAESFINGELHPAQNDMGRTAAKMALAYQKLGLIAHIDEATGYQSERAADDLDVAVSRFISQEPYDWELLWEPETVTAICDLYGWRQDGNRIPPQMKSIMEMIYRLALGNTIVNELQIISPNPNFDTLQHRHIHPEHKPKLKAIIRNCSLLAKHSATPDEWKRKIRQELTGSAMTRKEKPAAPEQTSFWKSLLGLMKPSKA
jgi:hypothetical protein